MTRTTSAQEHQALRERVDKVDEKLDRLLVAVERLQADAAHAAQTRADNKASLEKLAEEIAATKEIVSAWEAVKGARTVAKWVGATIRWVAGIGAGVVFLWAAWKGVDAGPRP